MLKEAGYCNLQGSYRVILTSDGHKYMECRHKGRAVTLLQRIDKGEVSQKHTVERHAVVIFGIGKD